MSFKGKVVLITGGSSGIGANLAESFTKEDALVAIVGRNAEGLKTTSDACAKYGRAPLTLVGDLTNTKDVSRVVQEIIKKHGKIDVLVNNAGFTNYSSFLDKDCLQVFDKVINLNLRAVVDMTNQAAPFLIESKGCIINISTIGAVKVVPLFWAYSCAKAALDHFSRISALEFAPKGVRVNIVSPGPVRTNFAKAICSDDTMIDLFYEKCRQDMPLGRVSEAKEVSDLVIFLASDKAVGITGSTYDVNNGAGLLGLNVIT